MADRLNHPLNHFNNTARRIQYDYERIPPLGFGFGSETHPHIQARNNGAHDCHCVRLERGLDCSKVPIQLPLDGVIKRVQVYLQRILASAFSFQQSRLPLPTHFGRILPSNRRERRALIKEGIPRNSSSRFAPGTQAPSLSSCGWYGIPKSSHSPRRGQNSTIPAVMGLAWLLLRGSASKRVKQHKWLKNGRLTALETQKVPSI